MHRQHRLVSAQLPSYEGRDEQGTDRQRAGDLAARPAGLVSAHERPDDAKRAAGYQREAAEVEAAVRPEALLHPGEHERDRDQPDRDVEPKDPLPADPLDHGAADQRPAGDGQPGDRAEIPIAVPRRSDGKAALSSARPSGISSAEPAP